MNMTSHVLCKTSTCVSFGCFHAHQNGNGMATVRELDVLPAHEGEVKLIDTGHSGGTVFPAIHFFTALSPSPQLKVLGLQ